MAFTVELTIRGLFAFVPSEPVNYELLGEPGQSGQPGEPQLIDEMTVLVMNAKEPRVIPNRGNPPLDLQVCSHLPLLRYPQPEENQLSGFLVLDGHRIEILDADESELAGGMTLDPSFKDWIPMELVLWDKITQNQEAARIDPKFLDDPVPVEIAGKLKLKTGVVQTGNSIGIWDFVPEITTLDFDRFKFASEALISIPIQGDSAVLKVFPRQGDPIRKDLRPKRGNLAGNRRVDLLLSNLCFKDDEQRRGGLEEDFAVFYDLLTQYDQVRRIPRLFGQGGGQGTAQGGANESPACTGMTATRGSG